MADRLCYRYMISFYKIYHHRVIREHCAYLEEHHQYFLLPVAVTFAEFICHTLRKQNNVRINNNTLSPQNSIQNFKYRWHQDVASLNTLPKIIFNVHTGAIQSDPLELDGSFLKAVIINKTHTQVKDCNKSNDDFIFAKHLQAYYRLKKHTKRSIPTLWKFDCMSWHAHMCWACTEWVQYIIYYIQQSVACSASPNWHRYYHVYLWSKESI